MFEVGRIVLVIVWLVATCYHAYLEAVNLKRPQFTQVMAKNAAMLAYYFSTPTLAFLLLSIILSFNSSNFQFPTYIILMFSYFELMVVSAFGIHQLRKRQSALSSNEMEEVDRISRLISVGLLVAIPAGLLALAAEINILTGWISDILL